jgi:hypothetical protein
LTNLSHYGFSRQSFETADYTQARELIEDFEYSSRNSIVVESFLVVMSCVKRENAGLRLRGPTIGLQMVIEGLMEHGWKVHKAITNRVEFSFGRD